MSGTIDDMEEYRRDKREKIVPLNPGWGGTFYYYYPTRTLPQHVLSRVRCTPHIAYQKVRFHMCKYLVEKEEELKKESPSLFRFHQNVEKFRQIFPFTWLPFAAFHFLHYPMTLGPYVVAASLISNQIKRPFPADSELLINNIGNIDDDDWKKNLRKNFEIFAKFEILQSLLAGAAVIYGFHFLHVRIETVAFINKEYSLKNRMVYKWLLTKFWREKHPKSVSAYTVAIGVAFGVLDYFYRRWPTKTILDNFDDVYKD